MRIKSIKNLICIVTMSIMLFGTLGMGVFAADQTVEGSNDEGTTMEQDQQTSGEGQEETTENVTVDEEEPAVPEDGAKLDNEALKGVELPEYLDKGVEEIKTLSGHRRIMIKWDAITDETITPVSPEPSGEGEGEGEGEPEVQDPIPVTITKYVILRKQKDLVGADYEAYATIAVNADGTVDTENCSGHAFDSEWAYTEDDETYTNNNNKMRKSKWYKTNLDRSKQIEYNEGTYSFQDGDVGDGLIDSYSGKIRGGIFCYKVIPYGTVNTDLGDKTKGDEYGYDIDKAVSKGDQCVRTSFVTVKLKSKARLHSHIGEKENKSYKHNAIWHTFKSGSKIYTTGFGVGQYVFIWQDQVFYMNRIRTKSQTTNYAQNKTENLYTDEECEYFINNQQSNRGESKGKYLIWVNTYSQRIYIFTGSKGNWEVYKGKNHSWKVSTGKAKTPTIRHIDPKDNQLSSGRKIGMYADIWKKLSSRHGIKHWNCFSSYNAIHGQKSGWSFGKPHSGGCVRNPKSQAKWVYYNCPKGNNKTRVIIF